VRLRSCVGLGAFAAVTSLAPRALAAEPWVDRPISLPGGDFAFDVGIGVGHDDTVPPDRSETNAGFNLEAAWGIISRVQLDVRTGVRFGDAVERNIQPDRYGRLFDRQTFDEGAAVFANPEIGVLGVPLRTSIVELGLEGRVVLPFADGTDAGVLFGVPITFHLGGIVRIDTGAYLPVIFWPHNAEVDLSVPIDVWIQATSRFWVGPQTGLFFGRLGQREGYTHVSLGVGLGYAITHAIDLKGSLLFPGIVNDGNVFGFGFGAQFRIE
jgi:hypothetical protein